jgi:hypothetical protein
MYYGPHDTPHAGKICYHVVNGIYSYIDYVACGFFRVYAPVSPLTGNAFGRMTVQWISARRTPEGDSYSYTYGPIASPIGYDVTEWLY